MSREMDEMFPRAARHFEDKSLRRQNGTQNLQDRLAVSRDCGGYEAFIWHSARRRAFEVHEFTPQARRDGAAQSIQEGRLSAERRRVTASEVFRLRVRNDKTSAFSKFMTLTILCR